jgi:hypothetical protein
MGYDLHIEREDGTITREEWNKIVYEDEEIHIESVTQFKLPTGQVLSMPEIEMAVWKSDEKYAVYFSYRKGLITVKNPDERAIKKMKQLAQKLQAKVIGDEGEEY